MRLSVFIANTPSTQLIIDLQKIYANYLPEASLTEQVLAELITQTTSRLYMTMFNERHIGAVNVQLNATLATLSQLTIRDLTRRRGIGKNLLKQIEKSLREEGIKDIEYDLKEVAEEQWLATQKFLSDSVYQLNNNIASKQL